MKGMKLPEGWKKVKLLDLGKILTGNTPSKKCKEYYNSNDIMFIKPDDLKENTINKINSSKAYISSIGAEKARKVPSGSILVTCIGIIGKVAILEKEACFNQQINGIVPNNNVVNSKFVGYYILKYNYLLKALANAPIVPIINKTQFSEIEIEIPPLEIQKEIVEVLEKAESAIEKRKESIKLLDELVKSKFIEMFGDPVLNPMKFPKIKLEKLGDWKTGGTPSRSNNGYFNGDIPWLSSGELNNMYCFSSAEMITELAIKESSAKIIQKGSLLLGMYDTAALKSTINMIECSCNQAIAYAKLDENVVNSIYIYYCIQIGKEFYKGQQRGVRQKNLNLLMIKGLEVLMPDLHLQNQFGDFVKQVYKLKFQMESSLKELENNFNSLMQRAFKGELFS